MSAKQEIIARDEASAPAEVMTPMTMLDRAVAQGASIEVLEKLMALQERWEANRARKAFDAAMSAAKAEIPVITKNKHVGFDSKKAGAARTDYWHEDLGEIARTVNPILAKHGLSYRYRATSEINQPVTVTCIVSHRDGHYEETTLTAPRDESGNKNSIQSVGSSVTFLQRYTLKAALGLAAAKDDDGRRADEEGGSINADQLAELQAILDENHGDIAKFCQALRVDALADIPAARFEEAKGRLNQWVATLKQKAART